VRLSERLGKQRDPDHQFRPGAETSDKAVDGKVENAQREPLQRSEHAVDRNTEGERAHSADIVGEDAE